MIVIKVCEKYGLIEWCIQFRVNPIPFGDIRTIWR